MTIYGRRYLNISLDIEQFKLCIEIYSVSLNMRINQNITNIYLRKTRYAQYKGREKDHIFNQYFNNYYDNKKLQSKKK